MTPSVRTYAPTRSSEPHPRAPPPDPRLKPGPVFVASGGVKIGNMQCSGAGAVEAAAKTAARARSWRVSCPGARSVPPPASPPPLLPWHSARRGPRARRRPRPRSAARARRGPGLRAVFHTLQSVSEAETVTTGCRRITSNGGKHAMWACEPILFPLAPHLCHAVFDVDEPYGRESCSTPHRQVHLSAHGTRKSWFRMM